MRPLFQKNNLLREGRATAILALPLIAGQLSQMLIAVADTVMIGRLGVTELAAATFANSVLYLPFMCGVGMTIAISIRVSEARGADDRATARGALRHGFYLSLAVGVITMLAVWGIQPFLWMFRQEPAVVAAVPRYFLIVAASMIPALGAMAVKSHADAMNLPWTPLWILLGGGALNVALNWVFIYGHLGAPALGLDGAAVATLIARLATLAAMLRWCTRAPAMRDWVPARWFRAPDWQAVRQLVALGLPSGLQLLAEVGAFVLAALIIGSLGPVPLASHQVAITCAATIFMIPLGLSMALTVRLGEARGAGEIPRLRPILVSGWAIALAIIAFTAQGFLFFNHDIARWFIADPAAIALAAQLLLIAAVFQASDAVQIVSAGALRGLGDVRAPAWIVFVAYWIISLPVGWVLAFPGGHGAVGMWWGLTLGLTITALALALRVWWKTAPPRP